MLIRCPELSFLVVDPGGTTGFVAYDGWRDELWGDQWIGVENDLVTNQKRPGPRRSRGFKAKMPFDMLLERERMVTFRMLTMLHALGPHTLVVYEDFVLGLSSDRGGDGMGFGASGGREGVSPIRLISMWSILSEWAGAWNGDLWRRWPTGLGGIDPRGASVDKFGASYWSMPLLDRMCEPLAESGVGADRLTWGHGGAEMFFQMPGERKVITDERLHLWGAWSPGKAHLNDAMRHAIVRWRKMGIGGKIVRKPDLLRRTGYSKLVQRRS